jgi:multimeric flavodoxin WrbA
MKILIKGFLSMNILILSSSPNPDGYTAACAAAAEAGALASGAEVKRVSLNERSLLTCAVCGNGWGTCRDQGVCTGVKDDFGELQKSVNESDAVILVTPVYWGGVSEPLRCFLDRLRRCEALRSESKLKGKTYLLVAAAGGSGGGTMTCLADMERFVRSTGGKVFDYFSMNRWNREYKLKALKEAAESLASQN